MIGERNQLKTIKKITYQDLIDQLYKLMTTEGRLPRIPSTKFNNFITGYLMDTNNIQATRKEGAWEKLKGMPVQKEYAAYKRYLLTKQDPHKK